jgi:hypothetical protein
VNPSARPALAAYLDAWSRKDAAALERAVHADVTFRSPTATTTGRAAYVAAATRVFPLLESLAVRATFLDGERAMVAYDFVCRAPIGRSPTAELLRFEGDQVRESEVFFDARPFEAFVRARSSTP